MRCGGRETETGMGEEEGEGGGGGEEEGGGGGREATGRPGRNRNEAKEMYENMNNWVGTNTRMDG